MHIFSRDQGFYVYAAFMDFLCHYYANVSAGNKCAFCETFVVTD